MTPTLTPAEFEVLRLVAEGIEGQEIADRLYKSLGTVRSQCKSAYAKLGATNAAHAVHLAHQQGILE